MLMFDCLLSFRQVQLKINTKAKNIAVPGFPSNAKSDIYILQIVQSMHNLYHNVIKFTQSVFCCDEELNEKLRFRLKLN